MSLFVNHEKIEEAELREQARTIRPKLMQTMADLDPAAREARIRQWAREDVIERTVLRQAALADPEPLPEDVVDRAIESVGGEPPEDMQALRQQMVVRLRIYRLLQRVTAHLVPPRNKEIVEYYRKHRESLVKPESVQALHILKLVEASDDEAAQLAKLEVVRDLERQVREGADFEELADQHSDDRHSPRGNLGIFTRGQMVPEFEAMAFALQPGEISPVVRTKFGYHIIKLQARFAAGIPTLDQVREELSERLFELKKQRTIKDFIERLLKKAVIREEMVGG